MDKPESKLLLVRMSEDSMSSLILR